MNRTLVFGLAMFFAIVGIALIGGSNQAVAGHGCCGCHASSAADVMAAAAAIIVITVIVAVVAMVAVTPIVVAVASRLARLVQLRLPRARWRCPELCGR